MQSELSRVLFTSGQLEERVRRIGTETARDCRDRDLVIIGVLKGAAAFTIDLARCIDLPLTMDWAAVTTRGRGKRSRCPGCSRM